MNNFSCTGAIQQKPPKYPDVPALLSFALIIFLGLLYVSGHYSYFSSDQNEQIRLSCG